MDRKLLTAVLAITSWTTILVSMVGVTRYVYPLKKMVGVTGYVYPLKQDRFETCFKDCARTGYETGPVKYIVLDRRKEEQNKRTVFCFWWVGTEAG